jgi:hypothetical protein
MVQTAQRKTKTQEIFMEASTRLEVIAVAYNWLHFYGFCYNPHWERLSLKEYSWRLGRNSVLVSPKRLDAIDSAGAIEAPCCLLNDWTKEQWIQEPGVRHIVDPTDRLLGDWVLVDCPWMGPKGKKLIPEEFAYLSGSC